MSGEYSSYFFERNREPALVVVVVPIFLHEEGSERGVLR